mgnify:CR=1 FL=1
MVVVCGGGRSGVGCCVGGGREGCGGCEGVGGVLEVGGGLVGLGEWLGVRYKEDKGLVVGNLKKMMGGG